ncbi:M48 family metallopeptidase [Gloeocapsa sp. PCC 73106]|uniref:tetratricopeptide repeat protein n=1 Tax=Gloeocapsa sp. PCC 73106 TaxID=102232 RepID=UPI00031696BA|nr:tetratricopeptide repeat protein [Gloeocapsa sp. PCC 73106]
MVLISGLGFLTSTVFLLFELLRNPAPAPQATTETQSELEQLKAQEQGYQLVLEREPDNTTALQGLVEVRLQLNDLEGAIAPLEKLIALYPQEENLKMLLGTIQQQLAAKKQK